VSPESLVPPDVQEPMPHPAHPDLGDLPDQLEKPAHRDLPENQECQPNQRLLHLASLERLETKDHLAHLDNQDHQDKTVPQDLPDQRESPAQMEHQDPTVKLGLLDPPDQPELPERRVFARNTVPPMEVSSSRTEHADKLDVWIRGKTKKNKDTGSSLSSTRNFFFVNSRLVFTFTDDLFLSFRSLAYAILLLCFSFLRFSRLSFPEGSLQ
jgi:hypothetical protein